MSKEATEGEKGSNFAMAESAEERDERHGKLKEIESEQLLPGLPNDVVLDHIVPKLSWRTFHILSSVCSCWQKAIHSRQVYDARVRSNSTETLMVLNHYHTNYYHNLTLHSLSLYSERDRSWRPLPHFPFSKGRIPHICACVALDGKVYVLGGEYFDADNDNYQPVPLEDKRGRTVYVLDLAGQRGWKQCANMPEPRSAFGCGVMDGKIYVFGGSSFDIDTNESLVYDPKEDTWSSIKPISPRATGCDYQVVAVGDELLVQVESFSGKLKFDSEVYHPGKNTWRVVESFGPYDPIREIYRRERWFTVKGKPYLINPIGVYEQDVDGDETSLNLLQSFYFTDVDNEEENFEICATHAVDGELLALISWSNTRETIAHLFRSIGFGSEREEIGFEKRNCVIVTDRGWPSVSMRPIQL